MFRRLIVVIAFAASVGFWASSAHADHIQYLNLAPGTTSETALAAALAIEPHVYDVEDEMGVSLSAGATWSYTFDLVNDDMLLWDLTSPTSTYDIDPDNSSTTSGVFDLTGSYMGSYDPDHELHYAYLRIDPNRISGEYTSESVSLTVNGHAIENWSNPVLLYDWGVPGEPVQDPYGIAAAAYQVGVTLTAASDLTRPVFIDNVNLEGCFEIASDSVVPEPGTVLLFGTGLLGLAGVHTRKRRGAA